MCQAIIYAIVRLEKNKVCQLSVEKLEIRTVDLENIDDLVNICVSPDRRHDTLFVEGMNAKKEWATQVINRCGSVAKLAYLNSKPVGMIQYTLNPEERLVEIKCIIYAEEVCYIYLEPLSLLQETRYVLNSQSLNAKLL